MSGDEGGGLCRHPTSCLPYHLPFGEISFWCLSMWSEFGVPQSMAVILLVLKLHGRKDMVGAGRDHRLVRIQCQRQARIGSARAVGVRCLPCDVAFGSRGMGMECLLYGSLPGDHGLYLYFQEHQRMLVCLPFVCKAHLDSRGSESPFILYDLWWF